MADDGLRTTPMSTRPSRGIPEGLWLPCPRCKATLYKKEVQAKFNVCTECGYHFTVRARERIKQLLDEDSFEEWFTNLRSVDPLGFTDKVSYAQKLEETQKKTGAMLGGMGLPPGLL